MHYFTQCFMFLQISSNFLLFLVPIAPNLLPFSVGWFIRKSNLKLLSYCQRRFDNETTFSGLSVWSISCHKFTGQWAHTKQRIMKQVLAAFQHWCMALRIQHIIPNSNTFGSAYSHSKHLKKRMWKLIKILIFANACTLRSHRCHQTVSSNGTYTTISPNLYASRAHLHKTVTEGYFLWFTWLMMFPTPVVAYFRN